MRPFRPFRGLLVGAMVAAPLTLVSGLLCMLDRRGEPYAGIALIALPFVTACVSAWYVHAVDAILVSILLSALGVFLIGVLVLGLDSLLARYEFGGWMFAAAVVGASVGIFVRPFARRRIDR